MWLIGRMSVFVVGLIVAGCTPPLNNPYDVPVDSNRNIHYLPLGDDPKTLDPVRATDVISFSVISNISSTAYEYDYHARPLKIVPLLAEAMPEESSVVAFGKTLHSFRFRIRKGLRYGPDECFGNEVGAEVTADDIIFSMKRTADRSLSPYAAPLLEHIVGFNEYSDLLETRPANAADRYSEPIEGVRRFGDNGIEILLDRPDLQLIYYFAIPSSAPMSEDCYKKAVVAGRSFDDGVPASGAFYIKDRKTQQYILLAKNPGFARFQNYTVSIEHGEEELPLVDEVRMTAVKSGPTLWRLFLQGYMDRISVGQDTFDQVFDGQNLTERFQAQGIYSDGDTELATYGMMFNLSDPVVGRNVWLRRAVACSFNIEELIDRFFRNRAVPATSLIPPGIEGGPGPDRTAGSVNSDVIHSLVERQRHAYLCDEGVAGLLEKAGYPGGVDPKTKERLTLRLVDVARPGGTAVYRFYTESAESNGWTLKIDVYDSPTYFEKRMKKEFQLVTWGWGADYADPQNFYQLFYGPNQANSLNESMYNNPKFDELYRQILQLHSGDERRQKLAEMDSLLKQDLPLMFSYHPVLYSISWPFLEPVKPHPVNFNQLKYRRVDPQLRQKIVQKLNPVFAGGF